MERHRISLCLNLICILLYAYIKRGDFIVQHRVQGIIIQNGKAILGYGCVDKINKTFRHYFIGGGIETVETPEDAILREVMEEANVKGNIVFKFNKEIEKIVQLF